MATLDELQVQIKTAAIAGDNDKVMELAGEIGKFKADVRKAAIEADRKEAESLAGVREILTLKIWEAVHALGLEGELAKVKAKGFTFKLNIPVGDKEHPEGIKYTRVMLDTPTIRVKGTGGGGGTGKTKDTYGLSLDEVYEKHATADEKTKMVAAIKSDEDKATKNKAGGGEGKNSGGEQWKVKNDVKKRVIASGDLKPQK